MKKLNRKLHESERWMHELVMRLKCEQADEQINMVGRTREEQQQIENEARKRGSLWPDLTEVMGPYISRWKRHAKHELLKAVRDLSA